MRFGAGYVVLTTKHHEGFRLWPSSIAHPSKGLYNAERDVVGDMSSAVRAHGMRMGLYYSGGYDWPFNNAVLKHPADAMLAVPASPEYLEYATAHVRELIDHYAPDMLWNDVAWPPGGNLADLFAYYYNCVPDGVINDRWIEPSGRRNIVTDALTQAAGDLIQLLWKHIPEADKKLNLKAVRPKQLCLVAFLPHILDSKAEGRQEYISLLKKVAEAYKDRPFSWFWAEGGAQPKLEATLDVG